MSEVLTNKKIAKNLVVSVLSQAISVLVSFVLGFIVPKFIDEYQYSYWQIYVLYVGYAGVFHFGLLDGLVLRYSQYDYDELDKTKFRSQFILMLSFTSILMVGSFLVSAFFTNSVTQELIILVAIGVVTKNVFSYTSYTFQLTNRISKYAIIVITQRVSHVLITVILLFLGVNDFLWYCIADLLGDVVAVSVGWLFNRGMYFGRCLSIKETFKECWLNISSGIFLRIAVMSAMLITGSARMIIQWHWGELIFGQVSFSFSVSNVFQTFIGATSTVLFPSLKRMSQDKLPNLYLRLRGYISLLLFLILIFYFPGCWILELWLPAYADSLIYLGILLPIIIFSTKVNLLTNNYLKAYRKEKVMLIINISMVLLGIVLFALGAYVFNNLDFVLFSLVAVNMIYSVTSEIVVTRLIGKKFIKDFIVELVMTIVFMLSVRFLSRWWACLAYGCALVVYAIIYRKSIVALFHTVINMFKRKKSVNAQHAKE